MKEQSCIKPVSFEGWALRQLREKRMCRVESSMTCLPLGNDPICRACYEGDLSTGVEGCEPGCAQKGVRL